MTGTVLPAAVMRVRELALSAACAASVRAAAKLGLADVLDDQPATVDELAKAVHADPGALRRLMRSLTCFEVFAEPEPDKFVHTDASRLLREDAPRSLKHILLWGTEPWTWELWPHLDQAVRTGKNVFDDLHGKDFFEYLHEQWPESAEVFDKAMTQSSKLSALAIADRLDLTGAERLADIAGGQGNVLATLLSRNEKLNGVLFDLPAVVAGADERLRVGGALADRAELVAGDCRREIPVQADVYLFKNILEWDDESTVLALRNAVAAGRPGARVVIIENLVDGTPEMKFATAMDLLLLLNVGGKKHTKDGLLGLIGQAGLQVDRVSAVNSYLHMVETTIPG
ncbi:C-methyltransferase [Amycolatopsis sulphurea]|uniref:C-methyltransferase n=1 Tax=Amycolatopsis sulphurea TaxID=76022 RepID=V9XQX5_9PSEU|nr:methyltransferase [Amycolatopsis sulphurea]AHD25937.1 putative methyltransferase [Amycolatopsis sulphurea]PFG50045.1 C-methyltransferase [Amycolatopsis sulphurea]